jgi:hypothetical protein
VEWQTVGRLTLDPHPYMRGRESQLRILGGTVLAPADVSGTGVLQMWPYDQHKLPGYYVYPPTIKKRARVPGGSALRALRFADAGGDIQQVLAGAVDLEHVAAILGLGRLFEQLVLGAAGRLLVVLNDLMGLAELIELMAHLGDDGLAHVPRQPALS